MALVPTPVDLSLPVFRCARLPFLRHETLVEPSFRLGEQEGRFIEIMLSITWKVHPIRLVFESQEDHDYRFYLRQALLNFPIIGGFTYISFAFIVDVNLLSY